MNESNAFHRRLHAVYFIRYHKNRSHEFLLYIYYQWSQALHLMLHTAIRFKRPSIKYIAVIDHVDSIPVNCVHRKDIKPQQSDCNHYNIHYYIT